MFSRKMGFFKAVVGTSILLGLPCVLAAAQSAELTDKLPADVKASGVITVGSPQTIPPFVFVKDEKLSGMAVELADAMAPLLGVKFEWQDMQWPGIIPGLQSGALNASIGIISYKQERKDILNMIPFVQDLVGVLPGPDVATISEDPQSLCGLKAGSIQGSIMAALVDEESKRCVEAGKPAIDAKIYASNAAVLTAYQAGNIDAFVHVYVELTSIAENLGAGKKVVRIKGWATPPTVIATAKNQPELAEAFKEALLKLYDSGEYQKILTKYGNAEGILDRSKIAVNAE